MAGTRTSRTPRVGSPDDSGVPSTASTTRLSMSFTSTSFYVRHMTTFATKKEESVRTFVCTSETRASSELRWSLSSNVPIETPRSGVMIDLPTK
jgi:hypothetical protein